MSCVHCCLWSPPSPLKPVGHVSAPVWSSAVSRLTCGPRRHPSSPSGMSLPRVGAQPSPGSPVVPTVTPRALFGTSLPLFGAQPSLGSAPQPSGCIRGGRSSGSPETRTWSELCHPARLAQQPGETTGKGTPDPVGDVGRVCFSPSLKQVHRVPSSHGPRGPRRLGLPTNRPLRGRVQEA